MKKMFFSAMAALLILTSPAAAHYLWLNMDNQVFEAGETVAVKLGWGHRFPGGEPMREGMLRRVFAVDPQGNIAPLSPASDIEYRFIPKMSGAYRLYADIHPGFVSKTTEGYKMKPKNAVTEPLSCFRYDIRAGARIRVGESNPDKTAFTEHPLEVVPLADPTRVKIGDILPVKVLFNGVALAGAQIDATYAGDSEKADEFAITLNTGKDGTADIAISDKGLWLVSATYEPPYPEPAVCDIYRYKFSLTFTVP